MEGSILKNFTNYKIWRHYVNLKNFECYTALICSIVLTLFLLSKADLYNNFFQYNALLNNIFLYSGQALIGMLGVLLAGLALVINLLNKNVKRKIEEINSEQDLKTILISFVFLGFNVSIGILLFYFLALLVNIPANVIGYVGFVLIMLFTIYHLAFIIFYTLTLIYETVQLFFITDDYQKVVDIEEQTIKNIETVKIEYILKKLNSDLHIENEEFIKQIFDIIEGSNLDESQKIIMKKLLHDEYKNK